jgi:leader peptidase (prepilin peptidase) / N-methyltransferase
MLIYALGAFIFGAIVGSFLNVLILRLPKDKTILGRSECSSCHHTLSALDLFPIFSYVLLRGQCRYCKAKISPRYAIIETVAAVLFALAVYAGDVSTAVGIILIVRQWFVMSILLIVFMIDFEHFLILDKVVFPSVVIILALNSIADVVSGSLGLDMRSLVVGGIGMAALFFSIFYALWYFSSGKWIGFGDVKFMLVLGLALAWPLTLVGLFLAFVVGGILGMVLIVLGKKSMQSKLPLGTFLSAGSVVALLWGMPLLSWYWSLITVS